MLNVKNVSFSYNKKPFLQNISFNLSNGEFVALLAKNGAGKSTLFNVILNYLNNYTGDIFLDNKNIKDYTSIELAKNIAYIAQRHTTTFNYSVMDMVLMGTNNQISLFAEPTQKQIDKVYMALKILNITDLSNRSFNRLSGGEQQLVLIARAIVQNAKLIIMDEPTSALDFSNQEFVMNTIKNLCEKHNFGILISSHNPNLVLKYCQRIIALHDGKIIANGDTKSNLTESLIKTIYNIEAKIFKTDVGDFIQTII